MIAALARLCPAAPYKPLRTSGAGPGVRPPGRPEPPPPPTLCGGLVATPPAAKLSSGPQECLAAGVWGSRRRRAPWRCPATPATCSRGPALSQQRQPGGGDMQARTPRGHRGLALWSFKGQQLSSWLGNSGLSSDGTGLRPPWLRDGTAAPKPRLAEPEPCHLQGSTCLPSTPCPPPTSPAPDRAELVSLEPRAPSLPAALEGLGTERQGHRRHSAEGHESGPQAWGACGPSPCSGPRAAVLRKSLLPATVRWRPQAGRPSPPGSIPGVAGP